MKSLKEKGDYEKIKEAIKNIFRLEDWQSGKMKNYKIQKVNLEIFYIILKLTIKIPEWRF